MPEPKQVAVKDLSLDLANFRTVKQTNEVSAVEAMISTSPDRFWALTQSLLDSGFLPTENIIVLRNGSGKSSLAVKEGNRRVAALKLIHGILPSSSLEIPADVATQIASLSPASRDENTVVPCVIFEAKDAALVDLIVTLAHGKGEKAGRDQWNAVARARHNRDANGANEPALDLLEKYLQHGRNITGKHKARWAGDYPLSVLAEAIKRIARRIGAATSADLANGYPSVANRDAVEAILYDIGQGLLGFDKIRNQYVDFATEYGVPVAAKGSGGGASSGSGSGPKGAGGGAKGKATKGAAKKPKAIAINDPKLVKRLLRDFAPRGKGREKLVALKNEAVLLDLVRTPMAFCFVLRSMFEISAKAYCDDHAAAKGPASKKANGEDRRLADMLRDITSHLTKKNSDRAMVKALHGAMADLGKANGLLSVTSMNQLVHNPRFSVIPSDIAVLFGNVFPLLGAMND
jgi:hypothetical protein